MEPNINNAEIGEISFGREIPNGFGGSVIGEGGEGALAATTTLQKFDGGIIFGH